MTIFKIKERRCLILVEEFGCNEVEVEEVYDLDSLETLSADSFGLIFLFKWANSIAQNSRSFGSRRNRASRNPESSPDENSTASDENGNVTLFDAAISQRLFFAHQVVPNSCASHALLSVLLNCSGNGLAPRFSIARIVIGVSDS